MSQISTNPEKEFDYSKAKDEATERFVDRLKAIGIGFWAFTEETGKTDTSSFDGIL